MESLGFRGRGPQTLIKLMSGNHAASSILFQTFRGLKYLSNNALHDHLAFIHLEI